MKFIQQASRPIDQHTAAPTGASACLPTPATTQTAGLYRLSTEELAAQLKLKPQTLRKRYAKTGAYFGVRPQKLANRRLLWPADTVSRLAGVAVSSD